MVVLVDLRAGLHGLDAGLLHLLPHPSLRLHLIGEALPLREMRPLLRILRLLLAKNNTAARVRRSRREQNACLGRAGRTCLVRSSSLRRRSSCSSRCTLSFSVRVRWRSASICVLCTEI